MPRDRHVSRALAVQRDPSLPPSLELAEGLCPVLRPDDAMKERLSRHVPPLPVCPGGACAVRAFFEAARADGAPVELDLGCGYGRFSRAHAALHPEIRVLGIEQEEARVARTDVAARRAGLRNVSYLAGNARHALEYCVPPGSVSAAFVLFPDPWPKARHERNRLFREDFPELVLRVLARGGVLHAATDDPDYFAQMRAIAGAEPRFRETEPYVRGDDEKTDFELKFLGQGKRVCAASWEKL